MHKKLPNIFIFLDKYNSHVFNNNNTNIGIIYRNYKEQNKELELNKIASACKKRRYKLYISNNIRLTLKYKADGIYLPSFNKTKKYLNLENTNIHILGSAHSQKEIKIKISQNCKAIFLSPIFSSKKSNKFLYLHKFNYLSQANKIDFYALGGISKTNIRKLRLLSIKGFGGISLFKKKPAFKRPVFIKK